ncbi:hypothetical protein BJX76DRAFT_354973 [Aspergillus varians]
MVDKSAAVRGVAAAFLTLSSIAVLLRCYVRLRIVKAFGRDDFVMILAMLFYIMFCGCMIGGSLWGTGKHLSELTPKQRTVAMKYWFLCDVAYPIASILAKISICLFLLRVMPFPYHRATLHTVTAFTVSAGIVFFVLMVVQCSPVSFWWRRMSGDTDGECRYVDAIAIMLYIFSAASAIFDLTVGLLPIILVRKLQMDLRTKVAVASILGMACVASIAIIIRIPFVQTIHDPDFLYATVQIAIWSNIETGLSITAGSLATIRPLLRMPFNRPSSTNEHLTASSSNNNNTNNRKKRRKYKSHTRYPSDRLTLATLDSGRGRNSSISSRSPTFASYYSNINSIDKERGAAGPDFFEPYVGMHMATARSTVEIQGGSPPGSAAGAQGREAGGMGLSVPGQAAGSGPGSGIGVQRTFEVSSSSERAAGVPG